MEEENKEGWKKIINSAWFYITVSIAIILYLILIVEPYANEVNMFSEGYSPNKSELAIYRLMIWPISIIYLIYTKKIDKFKYSLTAITKVFLLWYFLPTLGGGSAIWSLFFIIPFILVWGIIKGVIKDLQQDKKEK